jgi:hypothetical protein
MFLFLVINCHHNHDNISHFVIAPMIMHHKMRDVILAFTCADKAPTRDAGKMGKLYVAGLHL